MGFKKVSTGAAAVPSPQPRQRGQVSAPAPRRRTPPTIMLVPSPPATIATWAIDVYVADAAMMHGAASAIMMNAGCKPAEINERLIYRDEEGHGVIHIAECLSVLFGEMVAQVGLQTGCRVDPPQLYLEPMPATGV